MIYIALLLKRCNYNLVIIAIITGQLINLIKLKYELKFFLPCVDCQTSKLNCTPLMHKLGNATPPPVTVLSLQLHNLGGKTICIKLNNKFNCKVLKLKYPIEKVGSQWLLQIIYFPFSSFAHNPLCMFTL